jgi:hypothetical protein
MKTLIISHRAAMAVALLVGLTAASPQGYAQDPLNNGLVAYWPLDSDNGGVLAPDLPGGRDLKVYIGGNNTLTNFNANTITFVPGVRSNAASMVKARQCQLGYFAVDGADLLPPVRLTNWTMSFWVKTDPALHAVGDRIASICHHQGPNTLWDIAYEDGSISSPARIDHFMRQQATADYFDGNGSGAHTKGTDNAVAFDNTWHNITIVSKMITNLNQPVIDSTNFTVAPGTATIIWNSETLDSNTNNAPKQVNTNQNYLVQKADGITGPWTTIAQVGSGGSAPTATQTYTDNEATNANAFYRVVKPALRHVDEILYVDRTNRCLRISDNYSDLMPGFPLAFGNAYGLNGRYNATTLGLGGLLRAAGGSGRWSTCLIDDVAVWNRPLSDSEIALYIQYGVTNPPIPLLKALIAAAFPAVVSGDSVLVNWEGSPPPATLALYPGGVNVTPQSSFGVGSSNTTVLAPTTFELVTTLSGNSATGSVSINVVSNVASGWHYLDSFTLLTNGDIINQGDWLNPPAGPATHNMQPLQVHTAGDGNKVASYNGFYTPDLPEGGVGGGGIAGRALKAYTCNLGQSNTLFFRFYIDHSVTNVNEANGLVPAIDLRVHISDKGVLDQAWTGGGNGPGIHIFSTGAVGSDPMPINLECQNGRADFDLVPVNYSFLTDTNTGDTNGLALDKVYSVWIDTQNRDSGVEGGLGSGGTQTNADIYAVYLQREDWAARTNLFMGIVNTNNAGTMDFGTDVFASDRDMSTADVVFPPSELLRTVFIHMQTGTTPQGTNTVRFDDFYISTGDVNSTVPVAAGSFVAP